MHIKRTAPSKASRNDSETPVFSFEHITCDKRYSFDALDDTGKIALLNRIYGYRARTWTSIKLNDRHGWEAEKISGIKVQLPLSVKEDTQLLVLRYDGLKPMVGHRDGRVFNILFFDTDFTLYNHGKS